MSTPTCTLCPYPLLFRALLHLLPRGENRHDLAAGMLCVEHRRQAFACRGDDALIGLAEFVVDAVDVAVIDPGQPPQLLEREIAHPDRGRDRKSTRLNSSH